MVIQITKETYDNLSESEKSIIKFLNDNEHNIHKMSITTIANKTYTSPATVSRAVQKIGFQGMSELRYLISNQEISKKTHDDHRYVVNRILSKSYRECVKTIDNIRVTSILKMIEYIKNADKIFLYARGFTALVAEEFSMQIQLLGYNSQVIKDVTWMKKTKQLVTNKDLLIILSVSNTTPELSTSAQAAHRNGAKVVTCCCAEGSTLERYSDISIIGHSEEITNNINITVISRIPLYIMTRTIIEYLTL